MSDSVRDSARHRLRHATAHKPVPAPGFRPPWVRRPAFRPGTRRIALGAAVALGLGLLATASGSNASVASERLAPPNGQGLVDAAPFDLKVHSLADLSKGAPAGAKVLPAKPISVAQPAPATPAIITGLAANGIPNVALNAYRLAAARMASVNPGCGIDWSLLAGIGRIESNHGQYGGATLSPNGDSTPRIVGEALDGTKWDFIADTDHGRLDGDPVFDHAVGPMQFIPSTWAAYGADATGDGIADPFNINDAALGSAHYLCAAGGDLRTADGQIRAVLAYNHSDEYLAMVLAMAAWYATGVPVSGPIVGITGGNLPPVDTSWVPPVNPGAPPAVSGSESPASGPTPAAKPAAKAPNKPGTKPGGGTHPGGSSPTPGSSGSNAPAPGASPTPSDTPSAPSVPVGPASGAPSVPALPPLPAPPPVPGPVASVVNPTVCTITGLLGALVQIPCPKPTP
jgi:membrane-bound lytic murein transglycosylase B